MLFCKSFVFIFLCSQGTFHCWHSVAVEIRDESVGNTKKWKARCAWSAGKTSSAISANVTQQVSSWRFDCRVANRAANSENSPQLNERKIAPLSEKQTESEFEWSSRVNRNHKKHRKRLIQKRANCLLPNTVKILIIIERNKKKLTRQAKQSRNEKEIDGQMFAVPLALCDRFINGNAWW